jgi:phage terminase large subunit GpA-like protein
MKNYDVICPRCNTIQTVDVDQYPNPEEMPKIQLYLCIHCGLITNVIRFERVKDADDIDKR